MPVLIASRCPECGGQLAWWVDVDAPDGVVACLEADCGYTTEADT